MSILALRQTILSSMNSLLTRLMLAVTLTGSVASCDFDDLIITINVDSEQKISESEGNFNGILPDNTEFGYALALLGDLEVDGVMDLLVGAPMDNDGGPGRGAAWILFMDTDGNVDMETRISARDGDFNGRLNDGDRFGSAVAGIGDLNGDGFLDAAIGAPLDDDGGTDRGAVWVLFLRSDGTVLDEQKISNRDGNFDGRLDDGDQFGAAITALGDLDGDGVTDLAVGAPLDDDAGIDTGAVWILFMNANGTVRTEQKISNREGNFDGRLAGGDNLGRALANLGDLNKDNVVDIAVGAPGDDDGVIGHGAVWILFLRPDGAVQFEQKISAAEGGLAATLNGGDRFGEALANAGDMDLDGVIDLAVGAPFDDDGAIDSGAVWLLFMKPDGTVNQLQKISRSTGLLGAALNSGDRFGAALAGIGNLDSRRAPDLAVGAPFDKTLGIEKGAVWIMFMDKVDTSTECERNSFFRVLGIGDCT